VEEAWELAVVSTSASMLHELLLSASNEQPVNTTSLVEAIGRTLGYDDGEDLRAFDFTSKLVSKLEEDLGEALDESELDHAASFFALFRPLYTLPIYVKPLNYLGQSNQILSTAGFSKLRTLHLILRGKIERKHVDETEEYRSALQDLIDSLEGLNLPENLNEIILKRIYQVRDSVENFHYFGEKSVRESLEKLIGAVELYTPTSVKKGVKGKALFKALTTAVGCVSVIVVGSEKTLDSSLKMIGHYETISGYLEDSSSLENNNSEEE